jgi:transposase InsO family protein
MNRLQKLLKCLLSKLNVTSRLALNNIALRQQLIVLKRGCNKPPILNRDRLFWMLLSRVWSNWKDSLIIVKPQTVVAWHRKGFKLFWKYKSHSKNPGRPPVSKEIKNLVCRMANANPLWGAPRIHGELLKLGIEISERSVSNLIRSLRRRPPSQTWKTFLKTHTHNTVSIDFFTIPTVTFKILFVLVILNHNRRKVLHFNITSNPTAEWTSRQIIEAFPWDTAPKHLIRDRDGIYGNVFRKRLKNMGIHEILTSPKSPWQNGYAERLIGSIRRDCLDHVIVLSEHHLKGILKNYFEYYHQDRTHLGLEKDTPVVRAIQSKPTGGKLIKLPRVGGLHHRYMWKKAA